jgi:transposase
MATERLVMRKIREILRFHFVGKVKSGRKIARAIGCGKTAVLEILHRTESIGIQSWDDVELLDDSALENKFYPNIVYSRGPSQRAHPDWMKVHEEMRRRDHQVTLMLLWTEYKSEHPDGYQYSRFAELYQNWLKKLSLVMRQNHKPGEKCFVDFCDGISITDPVSGVKTATQLFVGALGASSYTFAIATLGQETAIWMDCHIQMYKFFGGIPAITVPDNLKSGIKSPDRYEAEINLSYRDLAEHYGTCIIPARVRKPKDKAKAEAAVLVAQRWILAVLRNRTFYCLFELNQEIGKLLEKLNLRMMKHFKQSRRELFDRLDRPALKALPASHYEFAEWKKVRLNIDYHVSFDDHYYSAPFKLSGEILWCRATSQVMEIFFKGNRVASHVRNFQKFNSTTLPEHMPSSHRAYAEWTPSRILEWAKNIGNFTVLVVEKVISSKPHPEQGFRSSLGIIRLANEYGQLRLEKAAEKALLMGSPHYRTIKTMLKNRMETVPLQTGSLILASTSEKKLPASENSQLQLQLDLKASENIRGKNYYH